jgi:hypothetical protein
MNLPAIAPIVLIGAGVPTCLDRRRALRAGREPFAGRA